MTVINSSKTKSMFREGMTPVVRSTSRPQWERLPERFVHYYRSPRHERNYVVTWAFQFDSDRDEYEFAYCYPYTYTRLQRWLLGAVEGPGRGFTRWGLAGRSIMGRRIDFLAICNDRSYLESMPGEFGRLVTWDRDECGYLEEKCRGGGGSSGRRSRDGDGDGDGNNVRDGDGYGSNVRDGDGDGNNVRDGDGDGGAPRQTPWRRQQQQQQRRRRRPSVVLTARVHSGETPSSFMLEGALDFLLSDDPVAERLRSHAAFYVLPMLNPDGVALGNYRCNFAGYDLNRQYSSPSPALHPSICAATQLVMSLDREASADAGREREARPAAPVTQQPSSLPSTSSSTSSTPSSSSLALYVDLHAHSTSLGAFMFGVHRSTARLAALEAGFPRIFARHSAAFSLESTKFAREPAKAGTARRALGEAVHEGCRCYTLEVSFHAPPGSARGAAFTEDAYRQIGREMMFATAEHFGLIASGGSGTHTTSTFAAGNSNVSNSNVSSNGNGGAPMPSETGTMASAPVTTATPLVWDAGSMAAAGAQFRTLRGSSAPGQRGLTSSSFAMPVGSRQGNNRPGNHQF
jgi:hypothetical protein